MLGCWLLSTLVFVAAAQTCTPGSWCWQKGWAAEYLISTTAGNVTRASAAAFCNGSLAHASADLILLFTLANIPPTVSAWTSLAMENVTANYASVRHLLDRAQWGSCWNTSTCCFSFSIGSNLTGVPCSTTALPLCQRPGTPSQWHTVGMMSEHEYGYFTRNATFADALEVCNEAGGSLAALPSAPSAFFSILGNSLGLLPSFWVGYRASSWTATSVAFSGSVPTMTSASQCAAATSSTSFTWTFTALDCAVRRPFLCQRLPSVPEGARRCAASGTSVYEFQDNAAGYTPSSAITQCLTRRSSVVKFEDPSAVASCFGRPAAVLTSVFGNGIWLDNSFDAIPLYFVALTTSACAFYNASGPSAFPLNCSHRLPLVCSYTAVSTLRTRSITLGASCRVQWRAALTSPALSALQLCDGGRCFYFAAASSLSTNVISLDPRTDSITVSYTFSCNETTLRCPATVTAGVVYSGVPVYVQYGGRNITSTYVPHIEVAVIGEVQSLQEVSLPATAAASTNISVTLAASGNCRVAPARFDLSAAATRSVVPTLVCDAGTNNSIVIITMTSSSNNIDSCAITDYTLRTIAQVQLTLRGMVVAATTPAQSTYNLFAPIANATLWVTQAPSPGTWLCVFPSAVNDTAVSLASIGASACLGSDAAGTGLILYFNLTGSTARTLLITLRLGGSAAGQYDAARSTLSVLVTLRRIAVTLTAPPIYDASPGFVIRNVAFSIRATLPAGVSVSAPNTLFVNIQWINIDPLTAGPFIPQTLTFSGSSTNTLTLTTPAGAAQASDDKELRPSLSGNVADYFELVTGVGRFRFQNAVSFAVSPHIPRFLYLGASAFQLTLSIPSVAPIRNGATITIGLSCGAQCFGVTVTPPSVVFSASNTAPKTFNLSASNVVSDVSLVWLFSESIVSNQYTTTVAGSSSFLVSSRQQIPTSVALFPVKSYYFYDVNYTARVTAQSPAPQSFAIVSLGAPATVWKGANVTSVLVTDTIQFTVRSLSGSQTSVNAPVSVQGPDALSLAPQSSQLTVSPILRRVTITIFGVQPYLISDGSSSNYVVMIDRAPLMSVNITLFFSSSGTPIIFRPTSVAWALGDSTNRTVSITTCFACPTDANTTITAQAIALESDGSSSYEVEGAIRLCPRASSYADCTLSDDNGRYRMPVIATSTVSVAGDQSLGLRIGETRTVSIDIKVLPFVGLLTITLVPNSFMGMNPPHITFVSGSSNKTIITVHFYGTSATTEYRYEMALSGTGTPFYTPITSRCAFVEQTLPIEITPLNMVASPSDGAVTLVSTQSAARFAVSIKAPVEGETTCPSLIVNTNTLPRQLPTQSRQLIVDILAQFEQFASISVVISPSLLQWQSTSSSATQVISVTPTGQTSEPAVNLTAVIGGNASSYSGVQRVLRIRGPSRITVLFPQDAVYPRETADFVISITNRVAITTSVLTVSVVVVSTNCTVVVPGTSSTVLFTAASDPTATISISSSADTGAVCFANVTATVTGSAVEEYLVPPPEALKSVVWFFPRRRVVITLPKYTFDRTFFEFFVTLETAPDPGTNITITSSAGLGSTSVWTSFGPRTLPLSLAAPYLFAASSPTTVPFAVSGSSPFQVNRYQPPDPVVFVTYTKLTLVPFGAPLRSYQVVGPDNAQTVTIALNRPPLNESDVEVRVHVTSVINHLLTFTPSVFRWSWSDTDLRRQLSVTGNVLGEAQQLAFQFSSNFSIELGVPDAANAILPLSLAVLERFTVSYSITARTMYVGAANCQFINVSLVVPAGADISHDVVIDLLFESANPGGLQILLNNASVAAVVFPVGVTRGPRWEQLELVGTSATTGAISVVPQTTPELSAVVPGSTPLQILPLVSFSVAYRGALLSSSSNITTLKSDENHDFVLSMSSFGSNVTCELTVAVDDEGIHSLIVVSPTRFRFSNDNIASLSRIFNITCFARRRTFVNVTVGWSNTQRPQIFAEPYLLRFVVEPDWNLRATDFPVTVFEGPRNAATFQLVLLDGATGAAATSASIAAAPGGTVSILMMHDCNPFMSVVRQRELTWTAALWQSPAVALNATYNEQLGVACGLWFKKLSPLESYFNQFFAPSNVSLQYHYFLVNTSVSPAPIVVAVSDYTTNVATTSREIQTRTHVFSAVVTQGEFNTARIVSQAPLVISNADPLLQEYLNDYPIVITTDATLSDEPYGFLSSRAVDELGRRIPFNFTANATVVNLVINKMPSLILISRRQLTVHFSKLAFVSTAFPNENVSFFTVSIGKYVANIVQDADYKNVGVLSVVAAPFAALAAPSVTMLLFQQNLLLQLFACPDDAWFSKVYPVGVQSSADLTLSAWMTAAAVTASIALFVLFAHFAVVLLMHAVVKENRLKRATLQKYASVKNRLTVMAAVLHYPTFPCVVMMTLAQPIMWYGCTALINSTLPGYRVASLLLVVFVFIVFPIFFHGVVWRSTSLVFIEYSTFNRVFGPCGFWWHPSNPTYLPRYWVLMLETRKITRWWLLAQYINVCLVGAAMGVQPSTLQGCTARASLVAALFVVQLISLVLLRPFRIALMNYLHIAHCVFVVAACVIIAAVTPNAIRSDTLQRVAVFLLYIASAVTALLSLAGVFSKCFAKPVPKALAALEHKQSRRRKEALQVDEFDAVDDGNQLRGQEDENDDEDLDVGDEEEVLHPGHPLYDRDDFGAPPQGVFRSSGRGFIAGHERSFSPMKAQELRSRAQMHSDMIAAGLQLQDAPNEVDSPLATTSSSQPAASGEVFAASASRYSVDSSRPAPLLREGAGESAPGGKAEVSPGLSRRASRLQVVDALL